MNALGIVRDPTLPQHLDLGDPRRDDRQPGRQVLAHLERVGVERDLADRERVEGHVEALASSRAASAKGLRPRRCTLGSAVRRDSRW